MKKYFTLILFFCFGHFFNLSAQFSTAGFSPDLPNSITLTPFDFFGPTSSILNLNSVSNYHFFNPYAFNPAMAGIEDKRQLNFGFNRQTVNSHSTSYEQPIKSINSAMGIQYEYHQTNFVKIFRYGAAYNYGFRWNENTQLRIGAQFSQVQFKEERYYFLPFEDNKWRSFPTIDLGVAFQHKKLRLGVSVQNLIPKKFATFNEFTESYVSRVYTERTLNISAVNTFKLSKKIDWSLASLLRFNGQGKTDEEPNEFFYNPFQVDKQQHDFSSYLSLHKKVILGATYRYQDDSVWIGFVGLTFNEKLNLLFSWNMRKESSEPRFWEALAQYKF